jgi:hypothetical protein
LCALQPGGLRQRTRIGETAGTRDHIEQITVLGGRKIGPMARGTWTAVRPSQADRHAAPRRVVHIADAPDASLALAVGEVVAAHGLGTLDEAACNLGGVVAHPRQGAVADAGPTLVDVERRHLPGGFERQIGNHCRSSPLHRNRLKRARPWEPAPKIAQARERM